VRGAEGGSGETIPFSIEPARGQSSEDLAEGFAASKSNES
jgi:hypothetical protein